MKTQFYNLKNTLNDSLKTPKSIFFLTHDTIESNS